MKTHLVLYSVNTWLAYFISETYYNTTHYVWCSPYFDCRKNEINLRNNPPSSNPYDIYMTYKRDVKSKDKHSDAITRNRKGLNVGAEIKYNNGIITLEQKSEIEYIIQNSELDCFRPLIYIVPVHNVHKICRLVPCGERASVLSKEFIIDTLPKQFFDIVDFEEVV